MKTPITVIILTSFLLTCSYTPSVLVNQQLIQKAAANNSFFDESREMPKYKFEFKEKGAGYEIWELSFASKGPYKTATFDYYKNAKNPKNLVIVFPITGGSSQFSESVSKHLAENGINVINVTFRSKIFKKESWNKINSVELLDQEISYIKNAFKNMVVDAQKAIDIILQENNWESKDIKISSVGISLGGIFAALLDSVDERVDGGVFMLSGADLAQIITESEEETIKRLRTKVLKELKISKEQFYQEIKIRTQEIEPLNYLDKINAQKVLLVTARYDNVIPPESRKKLHNALQGAAELKISAGHYTAIIFLDYAKRKTLEHLKKNWKVKPAYYEKKSIGNTWEAGIAKEDITPKGQVYIGGFRPHKESWGVNDHLSVRCLVLSNGIDNVTIISLDIIGLFENDVNRIKSFAGNNVIVSVTHTHSGPDTQGLWSRSGRDESYMKFLFKNINRCVKSASLKRMPVELSFHSYTFENMSRFRNDRNTVDKNASAVIGAYKKGGNPAFVILNFAVHPNLVNTRKISADFLDGFYDKLENKMNFPIAIFLNGAQGNVNPTRDNYHFKYGADESFKASFNYGSDLANMIFQTQEKDPIIDKSYLIEVKRRNFNVNLENKRFKLADFFGLVPPMVDKNGNVELEVNYIRLGPLGIATIPGEAFPNIGLTIRSEMKDEFKIICGLCNGAYGYILLKEDYPKYDYHRSMSVGQIAETIIDNIKKLTNPDE